MPEIKTPASGPGAYKIRIKFFPQLWLALLNFANHFLAFFNLKTTEQFWGIVYDSASKQPLDPVIVNLVYADGREVGSCVTDLGGRYGFLAHRGKFKILARKTNYIFPSEYVPGNRDGIYENLYHGEFFVLNKDDEVVAPNIPMDPKDADWNQKAKLRIAATYPYWKLLFRRLFSVLFWFGFIFTILLLWRAYPKFNWQLYAVLGFYFLVLFCAALLPEPRLWGKVRVKTHLENFDGLFLELHSSQFPGISFGKAKINQNGKFLLRANKGRYSLSVSLLDAQNKENLLGSAPVRIGSNGVLNASVVVKA